MNSPEKIIPCIIFVMLSLNVFGFSDFIENDTIRPQLTSQAIDLIVDCGGDFDAELIEWYGIGGGALASDNSGEVTIAATLELPEILDSLTNSIGSFCNSDNLFEVGFYALDTCGNTSIDTSFARFQVLDTQRPQLNTRASSVVLHCDSTAQDSLDNWIKSFGGAEAVDACSESVEWFRIIWNDNQGNSSIGHPLDGPFIPIGNNNCGWEVTVSFFVRYLCGNNQITTASFSLTDTIAPSFVDALPNVIITCDQALASDIDVIDNCNTNLVATFEDLSSTQSTDSTACEFFNYSLDRLWTVSDECGNSATFQQMIEVVDTIIPSFEVPPDVTIFCGTDVQPAITGFPTGVVDNCNPNPLVIFTDSGEPNDCEYVVSRFWQIADGCGSSNIVPQQITVRDTMRPVITAVAEDLILDCDDPDSLSSKFDNWLGNIGGASAEDDCASVDWFAAVPGSYDINDSTTFPGNIINSLDDLDCGSIDVAVDFVFIDACSNASVTTAQFMLSDTEAPTFDESFEDIILEADSNCMANTVMIFPPVSDNCVQDSQVVKQIRIGNEFKTLIGNRFDTLLQAGVYDFAYLIEDCSGNADSIVSTITILDNTDPTITCPADISTMVDLITCIGEVKISNDITIVDNCEIESVTYRVSGSTIFERDTLDLSLDSLSLSLNPGANLVEYFVRDEFGNGSDCSFSIDVSDAEVLEIECKNETIYLPISDPNPFELTDSVFIENLVDNCFIDSIFIPVMSLTCDQIGETIGVQLRIYDKTGDFQNCTSILKVDVEEFSASYENKFCSSDTLKLFANVPFLGDIDQNVYSWTGPNNYVSSVSNPVLTEVDSSFAGMYIISVTGEAGCSQLDTVMVEIETFETPTISSNETSICVGDSIDISATAYDFPVVYSWYEGLFPDGFLIDTSSINKISILPTQGEKEYYTIVEKNDCTSEPSNALVIIADDIVAPVITCPRDTVISLDSISCSSSILLPLDFMATDACGFADSMIVNYSIVTDSIVITEGSLEGEINEVDSLVEGVYEVTYVILDLGNNSDSCSFQISVLDNIAPNITCKNDSINLSISKLNNFSVDDLDILSSASDNCGIDTVLYTPNRIDCAIISEEISITAIARDLAGNSAQCISTVRITLDTLMINFTSGLCPGDTLVLSSNITDTTGLEFEWMGPSGFSSFDPSPSINNPSIINNGLYTLSVGSDGSCSIDTEQEIEVVDFATPTIATTTSIICEGETLQLSTQNYGGSITYSWFEGEAPDGIFLSDIDRPTFTLTPELGSQSYYVIVRNEECNSEPSESINIDVIGQPTVSTLLDTIEVCVGEEFNLSISELVPGFEYIWTGPNGYTADLGIPGPLIANESTQGKYQVVSKVGTCTSDTAEVEVVLKSGSVKPEIFGENNFCEGSIISLEVQNIVAADNYSWLQEDVEYSTTPSNSLVIFNASAEFSGAWRVVVSGSCDSDTSDVFMVNITEDLSVSANSNSPLCGSTSLQLEVTDITDASYSWEGPGGFSSDERNPLIEAMAGTYTVTVTASADCESIASTEVEVKGRPIIQEIISNIMPCASDAEDLRLSPVIDDGVDYTFEWIGPDGFTSTEEVAIVENFNETNEGVYSLIISDGTCESQQSNIVISFGGMLEQPSIDGSTSVCIGKDIVLEAQNFAVGVDSFIWTTPVGTISTAESSLTIANADGENSGSYQLQIKSGDCASELSEVLSIDVGSNLQAPKIISSGAFCLGETIQLEVELEDGDYEWRGPNDFEAFNANPVIFNISEAFIGDYEVRITNDDCTSPWSSPFSLSLVDIPITPIPTKTSDILCMSDFNSYDFCINQTTVVDGATYTWLNESTGDTIGVTQDACLTITDVDNLRAGRNNVIAFTSIGNCISDLSERVTITLTDGVGGTIDVNAGEDVSTCEDFLELNAQLSENERGSWSSPNLDIDFGDISDPQSTVMGFESGENILVWTVNGESCSGTGLDTISVFYAFEPMLQDDEFSFSSNEELVFNPIDNDVLPSDYTLEVVSISDGENADVSDPMAIKIGVSSGFGGTIEVVYEVCNESCPELCDQATANLEVEQQKDCVATNLITPNGDGLNDNFQIPCLQNDSYPNNSLTIFNQWGDEVYSAQPYTNNWQGTFNGEDLPVGTYFFILDLGVNQQPQDGFIQLER